MAQCKGLLAVSESLLVVPEQGVMPANVVKGLRLAAAVTGGTEKGEGLLVVPERVREAVLVLNHAAQHGMNLTLPGCVVQFREQGQSLLKMGVSLVVTAKPAAGESAR